MNEKLLYQIFECTTVVFETLIIYQYINCFFEKNSDQRKLSLIIGYTLFCFGLMFLSLFTSESFILLGYALTGVYLLEWRLYDSQISSRLFSVLLFTVLVIGSEIICSGIVSGWGPIDINQIKVFGLPRVFNSVVAKLVQICLVKIAGAVANWKSDRPARVDIKVIFPLLICQGFTIVLAYYVFMIGVEIYRYFNWAVFLSMSGIIYINLIIFWYFDRIRKTFEYKSRQESAEIKLELQKQYYEVLEEHQKETDLLWHDMKKHLGLIKRLVYNGYQNISEEYVQELEDQMNTVSNFVKTSQPVISALLTKEKWKAEKENVDFILNVRLLTAIEPKISSVDLCVLIGNIFDNAINACTILPEDSPKYIKAEILQKGCTLVIRTENPYSSNLKVRPRLGKHGLGLKNVHKVVNKYNGNIDIHSEDEVFYVTIIIP